LVEIACGGIFGDSCRCCLGLHGEIDGVIREAALLPEILDLFERSLQLLRIGGRSSTIFGRDVIFQSREVNRVCSSSNADSCRSLPECRRFEER
jgi:hypothetical protein